jgi:hypothetical protein
VTPHVSHWCHHAHPAESPVTTGPPASVVRPYGSIDRGADGRFLRARVRSLDGSTIAVRPGGAEHPLWGPSDRIVGEAGLLTVAAAVDWDRIAVIPPLADPTRLPPGAGSALLNLLAGLAAEQGTVRLRYRGPYATEQLFWTLAESFRFDAAEPDPLGCFLDGAEDAFLAGELREAPLDWTPAPHERRWLDDGLYVQLRDGVEKVAWEGRTYYRTEWQGLGRREHRVVRPIATADGRRRYVAGLVALGRPLEDHLVLDESGSLADRLAPDATTAAPAQETPLAPVWRDALARLVPLDATPLLAPALAAVWPAFDVAWGPVERDLVEARGERLRLSPALAGLYRAGSAGAARRPLAKALVREVLDLVGPPARAAAVAWLEAQPPDRRAASLEADRPRLAVEAARALARLLDALESGHALP